MEPLARTIPPRLAIFALLLACTSHAPPEPDEPAPQRVAPRVPEPPPPPPPPTTWLAQWAGEEFDAIEAVAVTAEGATLAVGEGAGLLRLETTGRSPIAVTMPELPPNRSGLLVTYGPGGEVRHSVPFEVRYRAQGVAATADGGALVVGRANTPLAEGTDGQWVRKQPDGFLARFDADARRLWLHELGGDGMQSIEAVAALPGGDFAIAGTYGGESRFFGDPSAPAFGVGRDDPRAWEDIFVARITDSGKIVWIGEFMGPGQDRLAGLAVAGDGTIAVTGECREKVRIRGAGRESTIDCDKLTIAGFIATWTPDGAPAWAVRIAGPKKDTQTPQGIAVTSDGDVVAVGMFQKGLGGGLLPALENRDPVFVDGFVVRYDRDGQPKWLRHLRGEVGAAARAVAPGDDGHVWVVADASAGMEFGDGVTYEQRVPPGGNNAALLRYDRDGALVHAGLIGGKAAAKIGFTEVADRDDTEVRPRALLVTRDGQLRIVGSFSGRLALPAAGGEVVALSSLAHLDGFLLAQPAS